jgi:myo-inositol-1(or 4)-monophosphatase
MPYEVEKLIDIVKGVARDELLPRFADVQRKTKADGSFVTEADLAVQAMISNELKECYPEVSLLGEEMSGEE